MLQAIRKAILRPPMAQPVNLAGRKFIVTGAAPGSIGFATALNLLSWGAQVTVTRRSQSQALVAAILAEQANAEGRIRAFDLDLSQAESVSAFAQAYTQEVGELDVLINNAGIHLDLLSQWSEPKLSSDNFEIQWRTNYLGSFQLTQALLPLLLTSAEKTGDARVVNVVSMLHDKGLNSEFFNPVRPYNSWHAYGQSKLALVHYSQHLQTLYAAKGLQAYCLHPGSVYTNVAAKGLSGNPKIEAFRNAMAPFEKFFLKTPLEGAQTTVKCASEKGVAGGLYYRDCKLAKASPETNQPQVAAKLHEQTLQWLASLENNSEQKKVG